MGQDSMPNLNQRGFERRCWHQWSAFRISGNDSIPFLISSEMYGLFIDTSWSIRFAVGGNKISERNLGEDWTPSPWKWHLNFNFFSVKSLSFCKEMKQEPRVPSKERKLPQTYLTRRQWRSSKKEKWKLHIRVRKSH